MASQPRHRKPDQEFPARHERAGTRRRPAHIHRIRAGERSRGVTTPVSLVYLPVSLTGPGPSGSTEPAQLCRGCSHLPGRPPGSAASSFTPPLRRQGDGGLSPPSEPAAPRGATCRLSAAAVCFLSRPVPATGFRLLPTGGRSFPPDRDKVPTFHTSELRPVPGAPFTPGSWCSPGRILDSSQHCRLPAADPLPQKSFHRRGLASRGLQGFTLFTLPDFPSPVAGGWITGSWDSSRSFTPRSADSPQRTPEAGTGAEHSPGTNRQSLDPPFG